MKSSRKQHKNSSQPSTESEDDPLYKLIKHPGEPPNGEYKYTEFPFPEWPQVICKFPNDWGASIINQPRYTDQGYEGFHPDLFEILILHGTSNTAIARAWSCPSNKFKGLPIAYCTGEQIIMFLHEINRFERLDNCEHKFQLDEHVKNLSEGYPLVASESLLTDPLDLPWDPSENFSFLERGDATSG